MWLIWWRALFAILAISHLLTVAFVHVAVSSEVSVSDSEAVCSKEARVICVFVIVVFLAIVRTQKDELWHNQCERRMHMSLTFAFCVLDVVYNAMLQSDYTDDQLFDVQYYVSALVNPICMILYTVYMFVTFSLRKLS